MKNDEFNKVKINNQEQLVATNEYFKAGQEYYFQPENSIGKSELNKQVKDEINSDYQQSKKKENKNTVEEDEDLIKEAIESASNGGAVASTSASSTTAVAITSTSAVVVTAFIVVAAVPAIISTAKAELINFEQYGNELSYVVEIIDAIETEQYIAKLTYPGFEEVQELQPGENSGYFVNLLEDKEYTFTVIEGGSAELSRVLLTKTFSTAIAESIFYGATVSNEIDFDNPREVSVTLDYVDGLDHFSDFKLNFITADPTTEEEVLISADLEATSEEQIATFTQDLPLFEAVSYTITYLDQGEEVTYEGEAIEFVDSKGRSSNINSFTINEEAYYADNVFYVTVDYVDELNLYQSLFLSITNVAGANYFFELALTNEEQTVSVTSGVSEAETPLDITTGESLSYDAGYVDNSGVNIVTHSGNVTFTDPTIFTYQSITFANADFEAKTIDVTVNYTGEINEFNGFVLVLLNNEEISYEYPIGLDGTTTVNLSDSAFDLEHDTFTYSLYKSTDNHYTSEDLIDSGSLDFNDYTTQSSSMSVAFEEDESGNALINSMTSELSITLTYTDYFSYYTAPYLELSVAEVEQPYNINLNLTNKEQTAYLDDPDGPTKLTSASEATYQLYCYAASDTEYTNPILMDSGTKTFKDSAKSEITDFSMGDFISGTTSSYYYVPFKMTMVDDYELYSDLGIKLINNDTQVETILYGSQDGNALYIDNFWQYGFITDGTFFSGNSDDNNETNITIQLYYTDPDTSKEVIPYETTKTVIVEPEYNDFTPYGVRVSDYYTSDTNSFTINSFIYNGEYLMSNGASCADINPILRFVEEESGTIIDETNVISEPADVGATVTYTLTNEALINYINNYSTFSIYLVYTNANNYGTGSEETTAVLCHENFQFIVQ